jgi:hypothetical protein
VEWLAREDPFSKGCEAETLGAEREASAEESRKRLSGMLPILQVLAGWVR